MYVADGVRDVLFWPKMKCIYFGHAPSEVPRFKSDFLLRFQGGALVMGVIPLAGMADVSVSARLTIATFLGIVFSADGLIPRLAARGAFSAVSGSIECSIGGSIGIEVAVCDVGEFMDVCECEVIAFMDEFSSR